MSYLGFVRQSLIIFVSFSLIWLAKFDPAHSQVLDTLYYNELWQLVTRDSAKQFRIAEIDTVNLWFTGKFQDFISDSILLREGQYSKSGLKNGPFKTYYPDGKVYCSGFFDNDQLAGTWVYYSENNKLKERVVFNGFDFAIQDSYDSEGNKMVSNGTGKWVKKFFAGDGTVIQATGRYYRNKRVGKWRLINQDGETILMESYSDDYFLEGAVLIPGTVYYNESRFTSEIYYPSSLRTIESFIVWDARRSDYSYISWLPSEKDTTRSYGAMLEQADQSAYYPLGMETFLRNVSQILVYPEAARARKIEGKVYVEFIVGTDGYLYDAHVLRGIGGGCDQQAVIAILEAGRWFPAQKKGFPVEQRVVIPVSFRLKQ